MIPMQIYLGIGPMSGDEPHKRYLYAEWYEEPRGPNVENIKYIRADVVDETIQTAEDHAYFAGKEKMREDLLEKLKVAYDAACNNVYDGPSAIKGLIESLK